MAYDPKTVLTTTTYVGDKNNNLWYWTTQKPWADFYRGYPAVHTDTINPNGTLLYEDGTGITSP